MPYNTVHVGTVGYQGLNVSHDPETGIVTKTGHDEWGRFIRVRMNGVGLPGWMSSESAPDCGPVDHAFEAECANALTADRSEGEHN